MADRTDTLRQTDDDARRLARGLIRGARFASLGTLDPGTGYPAVSRIGVAADIAGAPVFLISRLSGHFGALEADPRCSILCGEPGKGDPLAHPRVTVMGRAAMVIGEARAALRDRFLRYHPKAALYADFGDFAFWRLTPEAASLNGGFGKAYALTAADLATPVPDGLAETEPGAVDHMNADHADAVAAYATGLAGAGPGAWRLAGIDAEGMDLALGDRLVRHWFDPPLGDAGELRTRLITLARVARG